MDLNLIIVTGNVNKSPASNKVDGALYVNFPLAINIGTTNTPKTVLYSISASGKNAEMILNQVNVNDKLLITGKPCIDTYMGKDKQIIGIQKIWLEKFEFCSLKVYIDDIAEHNSATETEIHTATKESLVF